MNQNMFRIKSALRKTSVVFILSFVSISTSAAGAPLRSSIEEPFVITMLIIMAILLLAIGLLANVVLGAAQFVREKEKSESNVQNQQSSKVVTAIALFLLSVPAFAQDAGTKSSGKIEGSLFGSVSESAAYMMIGVIALELIVILALLYQLKSILATAKKQQAIVRETNKQSFSWSAWWNKLNRFKPAEQESQLELEHNYDGIRELDNRLPPWWIYGFYLTIIFSGVYLWRYHVSETAPLSEQEFAMAMKEAEDQKAAFLKKSANSVDETTVKYLSAAADLASGKKAYEINCAACHGKSGEGIVGPNLTDEYWLHGGSMSDIFKSIKYGWTDKGMKSWQDDFSPSQIAQISSYIKSIAGTKPANAKEPQGEVYQEQQTAARDSANKDVAAQ